MPRIQYNDDLALSMKNIMDSKEHKKIFAPFKKVASKNDQQKTLDLLITASEELDQMGLTVSAAQVLKAANEMWDLPESDEDAEDIEMPEDVLPKERHQRLNNIMDDLDEEKSCPVCEGDHYDSDNDCDYEECGECGFDHTYEPREAAEAHGKIVSPDEDSVDEGIPTMNADDGINVIMNADDCGGMNEQY